MFRRLFGETIEQQIKYLQPRVIVTIVVIVLCIAAELILGGGITALLALIMIFVWGWGAVKALFGIATIGTIFSGNVVIGVVIFLFYIIVAYIAGLICAFVGTGRYIYLKIKYAARSEQ